MELPRRDKSNRGLFDGIRSRLGFADNENTYDDDFANDYGDFGDYSEYSEYGPDYQEDNFDVYDTGYNAYPSNSADLPYGSPARKSGVTPPRLVSIDDVRAQTQVPDSLNRDPLPPRRVTPATRASGASESYAPYPGSATASTKERSESLDSLFTPTANISADDAANDVSSSSYSYADDNFATSTQQTDTPSAETSFDPYDAYAGAGSSSHTPRRSLTVLTPTAYSEVERIAKALKAGDAVVLGLRRTPDALAKRVLDFAFGVSSALDASVECIADKVFVVSRGTPLTEAEKMNLHAQGVL